MICSRVDGCFCGAMTIDEKEASVLRENVAEEGVEPGHVRAIICLAISPPPRQMPTPDYRWTEDDSQSQFVYCEL